MRIGKKIAALAAAAVLFGLGAADAQPAGDAPKPDLSTEKDVNLSPEQRRARSDTFLPWMEQGRAGVSRQLERARAARDVVKVLCLSDKLNQIDVAIRSAEDRAKALRTALDQKQPDKVRHEYQIFKVLYDSTRDLVAQANQCIGEETGFVGESRVTVDIDPNIPESDPSEFPFDPVVSPPPVVSSPTQ